MIFFLDDRPVYAVGAWLIGQSRLGCLQYERRRHFLGGHPSAHFDLAWLNAEDVQFLVLSLLNQGRDSLEASMTGDHSSRGSAGRDSVGHTVDSLNP